MNDKLKNVGNSKAFVSEASEKEKTGAKEGLTGEEVAESVVPGEIRGDPWRFSVAIIFCLISFTNAMQWITFSPIVAEVSKYFNMSAIQVNYLATTYVIVYVVAIFLSCKLYEVVGLKMGIVVAALANAIGAAIKLFALYFWPNMILLYIAQVFNSITEVLTIATPPLVANRWFTVKERMVANSVMSCALNIGCGVGMLLPTFFVTPERQEQRHFGYLFWFQFALCFGAFLLSIFFFPARPRYMVSYAAVRQQMNEEKRLWFFRSKSRESEQIKQNNLSDEKLAQLVNDGDSKEDGRSANVFSTLMEALRALRQNLSFSFLTITSAAVLGLMWAIATVLPHSLSPYLVTEGEAGWVGFLNVVLGAVLVPFLMPLVERRRRYKQLLLFVVIIMTLSMLALTLCFAFGPPPAENRRFYTVSVFIFLGLVAGLCQNFMLPLFFEFVVELTFPLAESTSAPVLTWSACLSNLILAVVFGEVLGNTPTKQETVRMFIGSTVVCFIGFISMLLVRPHRLRQEYEENMQRASETRNVFLQEQH